MFVNNSLITRLVSTFPTKFRQFQKMSIVKRYITTQHFDNTLRKSIYECPLHITLIKDNSIRYIACTSTSYFTMGNNNMNLNYDDLLKVQKDDNVLIIDVRESNEIEETGKLPGSIHIPMGEVPTALNLSSQEFENKYHKKKPTQNDQIVLSCRSGKRSGMVQSELQKLGYKNALSYAGGWLDWESHQKA